MNKEKLIAAFESAKELNVPLAKAEYYRNGAYCAVGWLASKAGLDDETIAKANITSAASLRMYEVIEFEFNSGVRDYYFIPALIDENDSQFVTSWDDIIAFVKETVPNGK